MILGKSFSLSVPQVLVNGETKIEILVVPSPEDYCDNDALTVCKTLRAWHIVSSILATLILILVQMFYLGIKKKTHTEGSDIW